MTDRETIARALVDVTNRWIKPNFPEGHKLRGFDELDAQEQSLNLDYADAALGVMRAVSSAQDVRGSDRVANALRGLLEWYDLDVERGSITQARWDEAREAIDAHSPAEGEPPNARNRIEARDKLIETLEAENTRLVSLVEGLQRRIASIDAPNIARALLQTERRRQIDVEGWTPGHDDEHEDGEMAQAASLYYRNTQHPLTMREDGAPLGWPWDARWWKPKDAHRDLVRAGALYLAEQERLRRLPGSGSLKRFRAAKYDKQIEQVVSALASLAVSSTDRKPGDAS